MNNYSDIRYPKSDTYCLFIKSLFDLVYKTYMGDDVSTMDDQKAHFNWCWDKTTKDFKAKGLVVDNHDLYFYFLAFSLEYFYLEKKTKDSGEDLVVLWEYIFDYKKNKNKFKMDLFLEVYNLMEKSTQFEMS